METQALLFAHRNMNKAYYEEENYITTSSRKETKKMKKFVVMVMIIMALLTSATAEKHYNNYLDNYLPCTMDVKDAYNHGTKVNDDLYYYNYAVYSAWSNLNTSKILGYHPESITEIETGIEDKLRDVGIMHPCVTISHIGAVNEEPIYRIEIGGINDFNKDFGENIGSGYIGENMAYNLIVCIGTIN